MQVQTAGIAEPHQSVKHSSFPLCTDPGCTYAMHDTPTNDQTLIPEGLS